MCVAFGLLGLERLVIGFEPEPNDFGPGIYVSRLVAFAIILAAIVDKNRSGWGRREREQWRRAKSKTNA
jgi:hypothetical protein